MEEVRALAFEKVFIQPAKKVIALYLRVSTEQQTMDQQQQLLEQRCQIEGWEPIIFQEKISGTKASRTELDRLMQAVRAGEVHAVMVTSLDRLGRSLLHLCQLLEEFHRKGVQFICLSPPVETDTPQGRFFLQLAGAFAELERELIRERIKIKLRYLKSKGKHLGRPPGSKDKKARRKAGYYQRWAQTNLPLKKALQLPTWGTPK